MPSLWSKFGICTSLEWLARDSFTGHNQATGFKQAGYGMTHSAEQGVRSLRVCELNALL